MNDFKFRVCEQKWQKTTNPIYVTELNSDIVCCKVISVFLKTTEYGSLLGISSTSITAFINQ